MIAQFNTNTEEIDLTEWIQALLNDIEEAAKYNEPYDLDLSKSRVKKISEKWEQSISITITNDRYNYL